MTATELTSVVEDSLSYLYGIRASGVVKNERSYCPPVINLLQAVSSTLSPKLTCVCELASKGGEEAEMAPSSDRSVMRTVMG